MTKSKDVKKEKVLVLTIEAKYDLKHLDYLSDITDAIERLRASGSAEVVDARVETK